MSLCFKMRIISLKLIGYSVLERMQLLHPIATEKWFILCLNVVTHFIFHDGLINIEVLDNHLKVGCFMICSHFLFSILYHLLLAYFALFVLQVRHFYIFQRRFIFIYV